MADNDELVGVELASVETPIPTDVERPDLYRLLIAGLLVLSIVGMAGLIALAVLGRDIPDGIVALASAAVGGLVGMLAPRSA